MYRTSPRKITRVQRRSRRGIGWQELEGGKRSGAGAEGGTEKLLEFHKNKVVVDSANTAALSSLLFMVTWQ